MTRQATLTIPDRKRLAGALALLGSDKAGEVLAAAAAACRMVQARGLTWSDVLAAQPAPVPPPRSAAPDRAEWRRDLGLCQRHPTGLTEWERIFTASLCQREKLPSLAQRLKLAEVAGALRRKGLT